MKQINKIRAQFLYERFKTTQLGTLSCPLLKKLFVDEPSMIETITCERCDFLSIKSLPVLSINHEIFSDQISNIETALIANTPCGIEECSKCGEALVAFYKYGQHLFIEVAPEDYTTNTTDFEPVFKHKFADIPVTLLDN